ncbi:MAG: HIT family hydrolase [Chloroflexi bacterium RBG_19FT_COMBO_56_12]|nr:MAG: HIT family hydrolase [Chloroflexi bacterium RBG_19FT_COMBO_56_12]
MKHLWSPWRMTYIEKHKDEQGCAFCRALERPDGPDNLIIFRGQRAFVILNRYPYTSGHLMVVPYVHQSSLEILEADIRAEVMELAALGITVLRQAYNPQGFNIGINIGEAAGAGITEHVHLHVVPRWAGDTSFMSSLGQTRVLPESLEDSYRRIKEEWSKTDK